jgi:hypothetical protein
MKTITEDTLAKQRVILQKIATRRIRIAALEEEIAVLNIELRAITDGVARRVDPDLIWDDEFDDGPAGDALGAELVDDDYQFSGATR